MTIPKSSFYETLWKQKKKKKYNFFHEICGLEILGY